MLIRRASAIIGMPIIIFIYVFVSILQLIYIIDIFHDIFANGRLFLLLILFFGGSLLLLFLYYSTMAVMLPITMANNEENSSPIRVISLLMTPVGLIAGYLLWQAQNWLIFGLVGVEPWLYNLVFETVNLQV